MSRVSVPFLFVNPKSYLWGEESLKLAKECNQIVQETGVTIFFTCPCADLRLIAENTSHVIVTAQNMDSLKPGRGMGAVLPESLVETGAKAVAQLGADVILAEPTELIGTGITADPSYTVKCCHEIKEVNPETLVMIASGITTGEDVYKVIVNGADGSGSTSGIINAPSRGDRVREMVEAELKAMMDRQLSIGRKHK